MTYVNYQGMKKPPVRQLQHIINLNYRQLSRLSMDLKVMPKSYKGQKIILYITDKVMNYLINVPVYKYRSKEIGDAVIENVILKYCIIDDMIMD